MFVGSINTDLRSVILEQAQDERDTIREERDRLAQGVSGRSIKGVEDAQQRRRMQPPRKRIKSVKLTTYKKGVEVTDAAEAL